MSKVGDDYIMKILYYGGCWETNIGNAFLDYGSLYTIKTAAPDADVYFASELARWFYKVNGKNMDNSIDLANLSNVDFLVVLGMTLYDEFIELEGPIIEKLSQRGVKIIFNGCGGGDYSKREIDSFKRFFEKIEVVGFISRDENAYHNYKDYFSKAFNGLDCAFFLREAFKPMPLRIEDYVAYSFEHIKEPKIEAHNKKIIRLQHECYKFFQKNKLKTGLFNGAQWPFVKIIKKKSNNNFPRNNETLISNIPDDYLNLYANAYATYSDRIHASIASLSFGNLARLYSTSVNGFRTAILERVGAGAITKKLVKLNQSEINEDKQKQISFLKEIFDGG